MQLAGSICFTFRIRNFLFPFINAHIAQTFPGAFTPRKANGIKIRIKDYFFALGAKPFNIVFPKFQYLSAGWASVFKNVLMLPSSRVHARTFMCNHLFSCFKYDIMAFINPLFIKEQINLSKTCLKSVKSTCNFFDYHIS